MKLTVMTTPPYIVQVACDLLEKAASEIQETRLALITDENVGPQHAPAVAEALRAAGKLVRHYPVAPGEESKSFGVLEGLLRQMLQDGFDRKGAVIALGGGVVGDLAGFVAATFMRGIGFYNLPTSLLAMVDASVGGKTGINLPEGKNMVGAFWQPKAVYMDVSFLKTLPEREFKQGAVELFKHALLADPAILPLLEQPDFSPAGDPKVLIDVIGRSVTVKAKIVAEDEREAGSRAFLNLGHTLAHALEAHSQHRIPHGDAVAYGLVFAAKLAALRGFEDHTARTLSFLRWLKPEPLGSLERAELEPYLLRDKKASGGKVRWVLLKRLGEPSLASDVEREALEAAWAFLREETR